MYGFQIYSLCTFRSALIIYYIRWCHKENLTGGGNREDQVFLAAEHRILSLLMENAWTFFNDIKKSG